MLKSKQYTYIRYKSHRRKSAFTLYFDWRFTVYSRRFHLYHCDKMLAGKNGPVPGGGARPEKKPSGMRRLLKDLPMHGWRGSQYELFLNLHRWEGLRQRVALGFRLVD